MVHRLTTFVGSSLVVRLKRAIALRIAIFIVLNIFGQYSVGLVVLTCIHVFLSVSVTVPGMIWLFPSKTISRLN